MRLKGSNWRPQQGAFSVLQDGVWTAKAIVPWRDYAFSVREGRSFPPPAGLWLLEEESSGAGRWQGHGRQAIREPII